MFICHSQNSDYAIVRCTLLNSSMVQRIPISYCICETTRMHAFGFSGHLNEPLVKDRSITLQEAGGFQMSLLSAQGLSGSANLRMSLDMALDVLVELVMLQMIQTHNTSHMASHLAL